MIYFMHKKLMQEDTGDNGGASVSDSAGASKSEQDGQSESAQQSDSLLDTVETDTKAVDFSNGKPEGFPDDLWDVEKNQPKSDLLWQKMQEAENRAKGLRDKLARGEGKPPKDPKDYSFKPSEKAAKIFKDGDIANDPIVQATQPIAKKYGLSKEAYAGFMAEMSDKLADMVEERASQSPEMSAEEKAQYIKEQYEKIGTNAPQVIKAVETWGRELVSRGRFNEEDLAAFKSMALNGAQVRVFNILRAEAGGGRDLPMDFSGDGLPSDAEISDMIVKAHKSGDTTEIFKVEEILNKRRMAGRPDRLQI